LGSEGGGLVGKVFGGGDAGEAIRTGELVDRGYGGRSDGLEGNRTMNKRPEKLKDVLDISSLKKEKKGNRDKKSRREGGLCFPQPKETETEG